MEKIIGTVPGKCRKKREKARLTLNNNPEISWHMKKSRRTYNGVHLNKKSNTQDVVEQSLTDYYDFLEKVLERYEAGELSEEEARQMINDVDVSDYKADPLLMMCLVCSVISVSLGCKSNLFPPRRNSLVV